MNPPLTWLYVPGDRPDRFGKAVASDADQVILDLEDAVAPGRKEQARDAVRAFLAEPQSKPIQVRINARGTPWWADDLAALSHSPPLAGVRLPKVEAPIDVAAVVERLPAQSSVQLHLLLESARGVEAAFEVASAHQRVASIGLGEADLSSDLGLGDDRGLAWSRGRVVVAARAAGLPAPAMSVYANLEDDDGLAASCREGRWLGFLGRAAIHPRQLPIIVDAFLPSVAEVAAATELLTRVAAARDAGQGGVVLPGGTFVDRAVVGRAELIVALGSRRRPDGPQTGDTAATE